MIHDLIDMRTARYRRDRGSVRPELERDRARTTVLKISEFGIMEMTRRLRDQHAHESLHRLSDL